MLTQSFCVDIPRDMFKMMYRDYCESHDILVPDANDEELNKKFNETINEVWNEYGDDVLAYLDGYLPEYFSDLEWDDSVEVTKAVAIMYIDYCAENPYFQIDIETYWRDLMREAMDSQGELS